MSKPIERSMSDDDLRKTLRANVRTAAYGQPGYRKAASQRAKAIRAETARRQCSSR